MLTFSTRPYDNPRAEYYKERSQDNDRIGFNNLDSNNFFYHPTSTVDLKINGQAGDDRIFTGSGNDVVWAGSGADIVFGSFEHDQLNGGSENDILGGGSDNDQLWGGSGHDELWGGQGTDRLVGGTGNDKLFGDHDGGYLAAGDALYGGFGNDILSGGASRDAMTGGSGADTFHYYAHTAAFNQSLPSEDDRILDFSHSQGDRFDFREIDANTAISGNQAFIFAAGPSSQAGRMWVEGSGNDRAVLLNVDGGAADLAITVQLSSDTTGLVASDFLL